MRPRPTMAALAVVVLAAGGIVAATDGFDGVVIGMTMILIATNIAAVDWLWHVLCARLRPLDDIFDNGLRVGHSRGYTEGRREARPVIVSARCPHCGEALNKGVG